MCVCVLRGLREVIILKTLTLTLFGNANSHTQIHNLTLFLYCIVLLKFLIICLKYYKKKKRILFLFFFQSVQSVK